MRIRSLCAALAALLLASCAYAPAVTGSPSGTRPDGEPPASDTAAAETTAAPETPHIAAVFEENEVFPNDVAREAAGIADDAIRRAAELLNQIPERDLHVLDCDYSTRPRQRDALKDPLSVEYYDKVEQALENLQYFTYDERDFSGVNFFNIFVSATDALRIDRPELFLCGDVRIGTYTYESCYYLPNEWLNHPTEDLAAVRRAVNVYDAVVSRILKKMPTGLNNTQKCYYFAFVISCLCDYDDEMVTLQHMYPAYDALVGGSAVCAGYAGAFWELCRQAGISCWYCRGTAVSGERHAWNRLDTEDGARYVDVTWYDRDALDDNYRQGKAQYLFMTEEDFEYEGYHYEATDR